MSDEQNLKAEIQARYGQAAQQAKKQERRSCCGTGTVLQGGKLDPITSHLYAEQETAVLPAEAVQASLGCGNPTALAQITPGETVLDLGSGGGIDVLLSARQVGPTGKVYGLDMTDAMLELARANQAESGVQNVESSRATLNRFPCPTTRSI